LDGCVDVVDGEDGDEVVDYGLCGGDVDVVCVVFCVVVVLGCD